MGKTLLQKGEWMDYTRKAFLWEKHLKYTSKNEKESSAQKWTKEFIDYYAKKPIWLEFLQHKAPIYIFLLWPVNILYISSR